MSDLIIVITYICSSRACWNTGLIIPIIRCRTFNTTRSCALTTHATICNITGWASFKSEIIICRSRAELDTGIIVLYHIGRTLCAIIEIRTINTINGTGNTLFHIVIVISWQWTVIFITSSFILVSTIMLLIILLIILLISIETVNTLEVSRTKALFTTVMAWITMAILIDIFAWWTAC